jgi:hypothetical protein
MKRAVFGDGLLFLAFTTYCPLPDGGLDSISLLFPMEVFVFGAVSLSTVIALRGS